MSRSFIPVLAVCTALLLAGCSPADVSDGDRVYDNSRIVSLAPALTETLFALGLGENVVGVSSFCKYPPEVKELPRVGGFIDTDFEAIVRLRPTCVVLTRSEADTAYRLRKLGIDVLEVPLTTFNDIKDSFGVIGRGLGCADRADSMEKEFMSLLRCDDYGTVASAVFVIWREYGGGAVREVQTAAPSSMYGNIAAGAGFRLLPAEGGASYPLLSPELLLRLQPDYIFEFIPGCSSPDTAVEDWRKSLPGLEAVKNNRIIVVDEEFAVIPGPRFTKVCGLLRERAKLPYVKSRGNIK